MRRLEGEKEKDQCLKEKMAKKVETHDENTYTYLVADAFLL